jgi:hypothetical protein
VVESLSNYARLGVGMLRAGMSSPDSLRAEARALLQVLDRVGSNRALDPARVAEVRAEIAQLQ